jgi:hypothetical protein
VALKLCDAEQPALLHIGLVTVTPVLGVTVALHRLALIGWNVKLIGPPALPKLAVVGAKGEAGPKLTGGLVLVVVLLPQAPVLVTAVADKCPGVAPLVTTPVV